MHVRVRASSSPPHTIFMAAASPVGRTRAPSVSTDSESEGPPQYQQRPRRRRSRQHSTGAPGNLPLPSALHRNNAPQSIAASRSIDSSTVRC